MTVVELQSVIITAGSYSNLSQVSPRRVHFILKLKTKQIKPAILTTQICHQTAPTSPLPPPKLDRHIYMGTRTTHNIHLLEEGWRQLEVFAVG